MTCTECDKPATAKGLCTTHYQAHRRREMGVRPAAHLEDSLVVSARVSRDTAYLVSRLAAAAGLGASAWVRRAVERQAAEEARP